MRNVLLLAAITSASYACAVPARASQRDCRSDPRTRGDAVVLLLDRTTILDPVAKDRWKQGVRKLLSSSAVTGELRVIEVRESATELRWLKSACLDQPPAPKPTRTGGLEGRLKAISDWWSGPNGDAATVRRRTIENRGDRLKLIAQVTNIANKDQPTRSASEIAQSIVAALQSGCAGKKRCHLLAFSDFMDTNAKAHLHDPDAHQAGARRATELLREYNPDLRSTSLAIHAWGFGRDDAGAGLALDDGRRTHLRAYWTGFFDTLRRQARNASVNFVDYL